MPAKFYVHYFVTLFKTLKNGLAGKKIDLVFLTSDISLKRLRRNEINEATQLCFKITVEKAWNKTSH